MLLYVFDNLLGCHENILIERCASNFTF